MHRRLTPEILLEAYAGGIFPMAESADDPEVFWVEPRQRGIIPLDGLHVPRRLARVLRQGRFELRCDTAFAETMKDPGLIEEAKKQSFEVRPKTGEELETMVNQAAALPKPVLTRAASVLGW